MKVAQSTAEVDPISGGPVEFANQVAVMRRVLIAMTLIALVAVSALMGLIVANGPEYLQYFQAQR